MRSPHKLLYLSILIALTSGITLFARPIDYKEVSLLVRAHESEPSIVREVSQRKLLRALTPPQEASLKSAGATDSLLQSLRNNKLVLSNAEAAAVDSEFDEQKKGHTTKGGAGDGRSAGDNQENVHVFDVSFGHPINLSQWGGPDYEVAFYSRRFAGEDIVEPVATPACRDYVHTATYLGAGRAEDSTTIFDDRNYVSIMAHSFSSRPLHIDMHHPMRINGVPYMMYPLCNARGVSLYYIGTTGGSVRLAAVTNWNR